MTTIATAVERQKKAERTVENYRDRIGELLPSHLAGMEKTWMRSVYAALRKNPKLIDACIEDPDAVIDALMEAARLGLTPGTDEYWLIPQKRKGRPSMRGDVGYQGEIELIARAGYTVSVVCDLVHERDIFVWRPGAFDREFPPRWEGPQRQPYHEADWFEDRGAIKGAYAYGIMRDGAISKVVIIGPARIERAMGMSYNSGDPDSPWQTDRGAMVLKTGIHDLSKFVPTSAEYRQPAIGGVVHRIEEASPEVPSGPVREISKAPAALPPGNGDTGVPVSAEIMEDPPEPPSLGLVAQAAATQEAAKPAGEISATWREAIAECVANSDQAGFMDLWESAKLTERDNDALAGALRVAGAQIKAKLAEYEQTPEPEPEGRRAIEKHLFALLGEGGVRDGDEDGRGKRLRILSRLTNRVPVLTTSTALTDIELGQVLAVLLRYQRENRLAEELETLGRVG